MQRSRTNPERTEATREALLAAARTLFTAKGYAETSTPEIVAAAAVTRGALYHHFADKRALFEAVVRREAAAVAEAIEAATPPAASPSARDALIAGSLAYLDAMAVPGRSRLLLLDGPAVLGPATMSAIDQAHAAQSLAQGIAAAEAAGALRAGPAGPLSDLLSAAFDRAALEIAGGGAGEPYRQAMISLIEAVTRP